MYDALHNAMDSMKIINASTAIKRRVINVLVFSMVATPYFKLNGLIVVA